MAHRRALVGHYITSLRQSPPSLQATLGWDLVDLTAINDKGRHTGRPLHLSAVTRSEGQ